MLTFHHREQLLQDDWTEARGYLVNEFDFLFAGLNVQTTGTPTPTTPGGGGNVSGAGGSATDDIATYADTTGKLIKDSGVAIANVALKNIDNSFVAQTLAAATVTGNATINGNILGTSSVVTLLFSAADYTSDTAAPWTVASANARVYYTVVKKVMTVWFQITATSVGGPAPTYLMLRIPSVATAAKQMVGAILVVDGGVSQAGYAFVNAGTQMYFAKSNGIGWTVTAANNTQVSGQLTFEIV